MELNSLSQLKRLKLESIIEDTIETFIAKEIKPLLEDSTDKTFVALFGHRCDYEDRINDVWVAAGQYITKSIKTGTGLFNGENSEE